MDHAGPAKQRHLCVVEPHRCCRRGREFGDTAGVPEGVRRLQVDEVRNREKGLVELGGRQVDAERRLRPDHRDPGLVGVEPVRR